MSEQEEAALDVPECEGFERPAVWKRGQFAVVPHGVGVVSRSMMSHDAYVDVELPDGALTRALVEQSRQPSGRQYGEATAAFEAQPDRFSVPWAIAKLRNLGLADAEAKRQGEALDGVALPDIRDLRMLIALAEERRRQSRTAPER